MLQLFIALVQPDECANKFILLYFFFKSLKNASLFLLHLNGILNTSIFSKLERKSEYTNGEIALLPPV